MAERSIRDFQVAFAVAPIADAWASANGFALSQVEPDGSRRYVRGSGLLTGQMMCVVRQFGQDVRVEAYIHARPIARAGALFLIPEDMSVEPGGFMGVLPRNMCRDAVDKLLAQLGQAPISSGDNSTPTLNLAPATGPGFSPADVRTAGILVLAVAEVVNALICLRVAGDFWYWFNYSGTETIDLPFAAAYLALAGGSVAVAWRLWSMRRDAWLAAVELSGAMIAVTVASALIYGSIDALGIVGIVVHVSIIAYLNTTAVRALFGRGRLTAAA